MQLSNSGNLDNIFGLIKSDKVFKFLEEKNNILEPNKICLIVSNLQVKLKLLLNLFKSISVTNNLLLFFR